MYRSFWYELKENNKPVFIYGTGNGADKILDCFETDNIKISGIFSSSGFKKGKIFRGFPVLSYEELYSRFSDMIILVAFGTSRNEVIENIKGLMAKHEVYIPDVPVYGNEIFDSKFAKNNRKKISRAYSLLCDDISRKTFENIIYFKMSGNPRYIFDCERDFSDNISLLNLSDSETFLDLGAYTGDTAALFKGNVNDYSKIISLEPDSRNYRKLCENTKDFKNCICLNYAVSDTPCEIEFSNQHGRGVNALGDKINVKSTTVDEISKTHKPTFIKFDVEGFEDKAIMGAKKTICSYKPKLHIAAYHKSEDIFSIPLKIAELNKEYKISLRHSPCIPAWDTNYIFI